MAEWKVGTVAHWERPSPLLAIFRLMPEAGSRFADYKAGQYIALRRDDCRLTHRVKEPDGHVHYPTDVDGDGHEKHGTVAHSYSISSAPWETREQGHLEFYIVAETDDDGLPGRLTESFFRIDPPRDDKIDYVNRIAGDFTLEKRAAGQRNVVFVGTGTGLAPFVSMVKQLHHDAALGAAPSDVRYTLFHTNRTLEELAYHAELEEIEAAGRFDFTYVASVSRPSAGMDTSRVGTGRANNLLRHVLGMPTKEEEELALAEASRGDVALYRAALERAVKPSLPGRVDLCRLQDRMPAEGTVVLTCGNPFSMADIKHIADTNRMRYEKEDWKLVMPAKA
jgi:ferredoxin-NADP reductase